MLQSCNHSNSSLQNISKFLDGINYHEAFIVEKKNKVEEIKKRLSRNSIYSSLDDANSIMTTIYDVLAKHYRNDIYYKIELLDYLGNTIEDKSDTYLINEFKIGRRVTDLALFNGKSVSFEIKSDIDAAKNIGPQFDQNVQLFDECYLVTEESKISKLEKLIPNECGILFMDNNSHIDLYRTARNNKRVSREYLFKILRKPEYLSIIEYFYGTIPDVPNTKIYNTCLDLFNEIRLDDLRLEVIKQIKKRESTLSLDRLLKVEKVSRQGFLANYK